MSDRATANEFPHVCIDCGVPLDVIMQPAFSGDAIELITCWQKNCLLYAVTLSVGQYARLKECDFEAYRQMNRLRWQPATAFAVNGEAG